MLLGRPLLVIDLETTGRHPEFDRIVEIAALKLLPDGREFSFHSLINPETPIPIEATHVHRISDRHVKGKPPFRRIASNLMRFVGTSDISGFNLLRFDLPLLLNEFKRAGIQFDMKTRRVIDVQVIFHKKEPRDLAAAYGFYCGKTLENAHSALGDASACLRVLGAMVNRYQDLPNNPVGLAAFCSEMVDTYIDSGRWFEWRHRKPAFTRGKYRGHTLSEVAAMDKEYLDWLLGLEDLPEDTRSLIRRASRK